jgi:hypothetical protein
MNATAFAPLNRNFEGRRAFSVLIAAFGASEEGSEGIGDRLVGKSGPSYVHDPQSPQRDSGAGSGRAPRERDWRSELAVARLDEAVEPIQEEPGRDEAEKE